MPLFSEKFTPRMESRGWGFQKGEKPRGNGGVFPIVKVYYSAHPKDRGNVI